MLMSGCMGGGRAAFGTLLRGSAQIIAAGRAKSSRETILSPQPATPRGKNRAGGNQKQQKHGNRHRYRDGAIRHGPWRWWRILFNAAAHFRQVDGANFITESEYVRIQMHELLAEDHIVRVVGPVRRDGETIKSGDRCQFIMSSVGTTPLPRVIHKATPDGVNGRAEPHDSNRRQNDRSPGHFHAVHFTT